MKLSEKDKILLEQWLEDQSFIHWAKQSDETDITKWEIYLNEHPQHWELAKAGRVLILGTPFRDIPTDQAAGHKALSKLLDRLESGLTLDISAQKTKVILFWGPWKVAASIAVLLLASGITYFQFFYHAKVILVTEYGQQLETQLPDGSTVTLNADSKLTYHSQSPRKVWLEGEAFFEVKKIPETNENFQVFTQDLTVTVLGTSFNVNARNGQTRIFLEEGKVKLETDNPENEVIEMNPGDLIAYSRKENKLKEKRNNASALENVSWKEGTLVFNNTPLPEALYAIEDIYGIQFVIQKEDIKKELISGGVPIRNLQVTLLTLIEVYGIQIQAEGKRYFISSKSSQEVN